MITINRSAVGLVIAVASMSFGAGCRRDPSTASRSAAAYDEAQRRGAPPSGGGGHGHHADASPAAGGTESGTDDGSAHAGHGEATAAATGHEGHGAAAAASPTVGSPPPSAGHHHPSGSRKEPPSGATMDHAAMGHGAPAAAPSPEAASSTARIGQPAMTLDGDVLDAAAPTSVREAQRSADAAASGHSMSHGTYRQVDAGREGVPVTSPTGGARRGSAPAPSPAPKENR